jgi:hypothetical protein
MKDNMKNNPNTVTKNLLGTAIQKEVILRCYRTRSDDCQLMAMV